MRPAVSILIPCFNAERWIGAAIESALAQTEQPAEVIVVNDGSTDGSLDIIRSFGDRVRYESQPNLGANAARNRLLSLAQGEWLQYLDADDYLLPHKIRAQVDFLLTHRETDVVFGPFIAEYWRDGNVTRELNPVPQPHDLWVLLARRGLPQTGSPLWRRTALLDVGGWARDQPCCQEYELYLRLLMADKRLSYHGSTGAIYRHWSQNTLSRRNVYEMDRRKLQIYRRAEEHMRAQGECTERRLYWLNQARFDIARRVWRRDPTLAAETMGEVLKSHPSFRPGGLPGLVYRVAGFRAVDRLAVLKRQATLFARGVRGTPTRVLAGMNRGQG